MEPERDTGTRSRFGSRLGFILAGIGAAVGLGSFWRFPQLASQNGGGAFVFVFFAMLLLFGVPLLWAELALGQRAQKSSLLAFQTMVGDHWRVVGLLFVAVSFTILGYYTILAGYVLRYALFSFDSAIGDDPATYLAGAVEGGPAIAFGALVALITAGIVAAGVSKGLEQANRLMMPGLFFMLLGLVFYAQLQPGASAGREFYLGVDWGEIDISTFRDALNQVFFAVGIGFGIMLTFASYTPPGKSLLPTSFVVSTSILVVGFLAGLMLFPLAFSQGLEDKITDPDAGSTSTLFLTMPAAFHAIGGAGGSLLMLVFFVMLLFSAVSSTIAAHEVLVAVLQDHLGWTRFRSNLIATEWYFIPGVFAAASEDIFGKLDLFLGNVLLFLAVIGLCLAYTFAVRDPVGVFLGGVENPTPFQRRAAVAAAFMTRYIAPAALILLFVLGLPDTWEKLSG